MPKLPAKTVKAPNLGFDSPFRPTTPSLELVKETTPPDGDDAAAPPTAERAASTSASQPVSSNEHDAQSEMAVEDALCHRLSVRFTDAQWTALQNVCRRRRMETGENTTVAELVRELVAKTCSA